MLHVQEVPLLHPYPWEGVFTMIAVLTGELLLFYALIRPRSYDRSWHRALAAWLVSVVLTLFLGVLLIHSPPYVLAHSLFLACASVAFFVLLCTSVVGRMRSSSRLRGHRLDPAARRRWNLYS